MSLALDLLVAAYPEAVPELTRYMEFVNNCQSPTAGAYRERHHVLPRSLFPEWADAPWNVLELSGTDHFLAHYWLFQALPAVPQVVFAWRVLHANRFRQIPTALIHEHADAYARSKQAWTRLRTEWHPSMETRARMSASAKVKVFTPEHRANMSRSKLGHAVSDETRRKISEAQKGKPRGPRDPAAVEATAAKLRGRKRTPEQIQAAVDGMRAKGPRVTSDETRQKMREASAKRWAQPENREQARAAAKRRVTRRQPPTTESSERQ